MSFSSSLTKIFILFTCFAPTVATADASGDAEVSAEDVAALADAPYCGIYSLYGAALSEGVKLDFLRLTNRRYVGCAQGSSLAELERAASDNGLHATAAMNLTSGFLKESPHPVILHVKSDPATRKYDHYVTYLGTREGRAEVLDPGKPLTLMPFDELATVWDGIGLIVSAAPLDKSGLFASARWQAVTLLLLGATLVGCARWLGTWAIPVVSIRERLARSCLQFGGLCAVSLVAGFTHHFVSPDGFLAHGGTTTKAVEQANMARFLPKLDVAGVREAIAGGAVLVDARYPQDFEAGQLPGAINIPVNAGDEQRKAAMVGVPTSAQVILYCQSSSCPFAESVARGLAGDGYTKLSLFPGGWQEWDAQVKP